MTIEEINELKASITELKSVIEKASQLLTQIEKRLDQEVQPTTQEAQSTTPKRWELMTEEEKQQRINEVRARLAQRRANEKQSETPKDLELSCCELSERGKQNLKNFTETYATLLHNATRFNGTIGGFTQLEFTARNTVIFHGMDKGYSPYATLGYAMMNYAEHQPNIGKQETRKFNNEKQAFLKLIRRFDWKWMCESAKSELLGLSEYLTN